MKAIFETSARRLPFKPGDLTTEGVFVSQDENGTATFRNIHAGISIIPAGCRVFRGGFVLDVIKLCSEKDIARRIAAHRSGMESHIANNLSLD
jgi:hypothetical protein